MYEVSASSFQIDVKPVGTVARRRAREGRRREAEIRYFVVLTTYIPR